MSQPKTHCPKGHEYTPENSMPHRNYKRCRTCKSALNRQYRLNMGQPPAMSDTFNCGHFRTDDNTRINGTKRECRTCYRAWDTARRQRVAGELVRAIDTEQHRERRLRRILAQAAAAKPHLYPSKQAA